MLGIGLVAFLGISTLPLLGNLFQGNDAPAGAPTEQAATSAQQAELASQVKGYEMVLQREPENQTALRGLLEARLEMIRLQLADVQTVIEPLEKLVKLNPDRADYAVLLAQAKQYSGNREGAAQTYRNVLKTQPGNVNALQGLVTLFLEEQRPEAAIGLLEDTLKSANQANQIQPGSVDVTSVRLELGRVYMAQSRFDDALKVYERAIEGDSGDFRPVLAKGMVLQEQGKADEAKPFFDKALELAPPQFKDQIKQRMAATPGTGTDLPALPAPDSPPAVDVPTSSPSEATDE